MKGTDVGLEQVHDKPYYVDGGDLIDWEEADNRRFALEYTAPLLARVIGPPSRRSRILSVGCGVGSDVEALTELGWDAHGLEPGYRNSAWARRAYPERFLVGDGRALPFTDGQFDAVTSYGVIEHVGAVGDSIEVHADYWDQRVRYARELTRVVRPGGAIILSTPNKRFPIDFFHLEGNGGHGTSFPIRFGMRWHSPREPFSVSYGEMARLFVDIAGCRSIQPLGLSRAFVFRRSGEHAWGRILAPATRLAFSAFGWAPLRPLARSPLNPFLIVLITR